MTAVLDHLAVAAPVLTDGWELFGGVLGGSWAYGGDSPGYWWGQLEFAAGPKIELLTPTGGPDAPAGQAPGPGRGAGRLGTEGDRSAAYAVGIEDRTVQVEQGGHVVG